MTNFGQYAQVPVLLDDDTMADDSDAHAVTQQSIVAYVASQITSNLNAFFVGTPGYLEFATSAIAGIAIQWGHDLTDGNGNGTDTFKKAFSGTPWVIICTADGSKSLTGTYTAYNYSTTGFAYKGPGDAVNVRWIAIGATVL